MLNIPLANSTDPHRQFSKFQIQFKFKVKDKDTEYPQQWIKFSKVDPGTKYRFPVFANSYEYIFRLLGETEDGEVSNPSQEIPYSLNGMLLWGNCRKIWFQCVSAFSVRFLLHYFKKKSKKRAVCLKAQTIDSLGHTKNLYKIDFHNEFPQLTPYFPLDYTTTKQKGKRHLTFCFTKKALKQTPVALPVLYISSFCPNCNVSARLYFDWCVGNNLWKYLAPPGTRPQVIFDFQIIGRQNYHIYQKHKHTYTNKCCVYC